MSTEKSQKLDQESAQNTAPLDVEATPPGEPEIAIGSSHDGWSRRGPRS